MGFDFDVTMLRIASMNLMFHGIETPSIHYQDTLSNSFPERFPKLASEAFDLVLANPPFKGSLDYGDVHPSILKVVKTKKTELLFIAQMLKMLKLGGRWAVIVPDGVLFGSSNAHVDLRKTLVEENQLDAVIKLPAGVFKPYAGVSTAILIFTKGGKTTHVWFYDVQADGKSLDDKRDDVPENDLPDVRLRWATRIPTKHTDRTENSCTRFDCAGMRWVKEKAEALLHLRCIELNGDWDGFVEYFHRQTHQEVINNKRRKILTDQPLTFAKAA